MRSLFLRIFLWFWLAMVAIAFVLVLTSPFFTQSRSRLDRWQQGAERWAEERVNRAVGSIAVSGVEGPLRGDGRGGPQRGHEHRGAATFVFDENGREVFGREAPEAAKELARRVAATGEGEAVRRGGFHMVAKPAADPAGRPFVVVGTLHRPPGPIDLLEPGALWLRMAALAFVVGGLSFLLARYLSKPVGALRRATQRLSEGDLTARVGGRVVRRRDEIGQLARDFDAMAERLEHVIGSQRRLLRDVSHELRSPLARLRVALELARQRDSGAIDGQLDRIELEAGRIDDLIGQLLLLERLAAGEPGGQAQAFDLSDLLGEVVEDGAYEAEAAGNEVVLAAGEDAPLVGHRDLVRSALDNVLRNAIRFAPEGTSIEVRLRRTVESVTVTVRDRGPGAPDDQLEALFEPFARVGEARDRASGGAGLGLAITRRAVELHRGTVTARNHPDGGLEVEIRLPTESKSPAR
jgi:two-component system sensor histidine kinase CpxA